MGAYPTIGRGQGISTALRLGIGLSATVTLMLGVVGCTPASPDTESGSTHGYALSSAELVVGVVGSDGIDTTTVAPLLNYLAVVTGKKIETLETRDYEGLRRAALAGQLDLGLFSPLSYLRSVDDGSKLQSLAAMIPAGSTGPSYVSAAVTSVASVVRSISDLRGKHVCFTDRDSMAGYLYPAATLTQSGIDPGRDIIPVITGSQEATADMVVAGSACDAGFVSVWGSTPDAATPLLANGALTTVSEVSVPTPVLAASGTLPASLRRALATSMDGLTLDRMSARGVDVTDDFRSHFAGFASAGAPYFDGLVAVCAEVKTAACRGLSSPAG